MSRFRRIWLFPCRGGRAVSQCPALAAKGKALTRKTGSSMQSPWIEAVNGRRVAALVGTTLSCLALAAAGAFVVGSRGRESGAVVADPAPGTLPANLGQVGADPSWWRAVTDDLAR